MDGMNEALLYGACRINERGIINTIIETTANEFNTSVENMRSKEKKVWQGVFPRYCAWYLIKRKYNSTVLRSMGEEFNRNHATVLHGLREHDNLMRVTGGLPEYREKFRNVVRKLKNDYDIKIN